MKAVRPALCLLALVFVAALRADDVQDHVISPAVRVIAKSGRGSGTIFAHEGAHYVITAGHVIEGDKEVKEVEMPSDKGGVEKRKVVFWPAIEVTRTLYHNGKEVGELRLKTEVVAFSPSEESGGTDVAVLKVKHNELLKHTAVWGDSRKAQLGDDLLHVGSLYGEFTESFVKGSVVRLDYTDNDLHTSFLVASFGGSRPGSSGGGVYRKEGNAWVWVGMIVRGDSGGLNLVRTSEDVLKFLKANKMDFLAGK